MSRFFSSRLYNFKTLLVLLWSRKIHFKKLLDVGDEYWEGRLEYNDLNWTATNPETKITKKALEIVLIHLSMRTMRRN